MSVESDSAKASAAGGQSAASQGTLTAPGSANLNQTSSTNQQSQAVSPTFGNVAQANVANSNQSNQALNVGGANSQAGAASALKSGSAADESIGQTDVNIKGGLIPGSGANISLLDANSQTQSQLQGQNEAQASGNASASSNNAGGTVANTSLTGTSVGVNQSNNVNSVNGAGESVQNAAGGAAANSQVDASNDSRLQSGGTPLGNLMNMLMGGTTIQADSASANSGIAGTSSIASTGDAQANTSTRGQSSAASASPIFNNQVNTDTAITSQGNAATQGANASANAAGNSSASANSAIQQKEIKNKGILGTGIGGIDESRLDSFNQANANAGSSTGLNLGANSSGNVNQANTANAAASNSNGVNVASGVNTSASVNGQAGQNSNLQGQADASGSNSYGTTATGKDSGHYIGGSAASQANASLVAGLQGQGAEVSGVSQAQSALNGNMGSEAKVKVEIQAKRFITDLEQALPNDPVATAAIERMKKDPSLVWLFNGSNSPKSIIMALGSTATTGKAGTSNVNLGSYGQWTSWANNNATLGSANINATINPNANANSNIQRYYQDPQTGKTFANVQGQVREIKNGELVPIDYTDKFTLKAIANATATAGGHNFNIAGAALNVAGDIKGRQYFYSGSNDSIYDQLAKEVVARNNNTYKSPEEQRLLDNYAALDYDKNYYNKFIAPQEKNSLYDQLTALKGKNISAKDLASINNWIEQEQLNRQSLADQGQNIADTEVDYSDFFNQNKQNKQINPVSPLFQAVYASLGNDSNYYNKNIAPITGLSQKEYDYANMVKRYAGQQYDSQGRVLYNGNVVDNYSSLLDSLAKEKAFDQKYGYNQGGAYTNLNYLDYDGYNNNAVVYKPKKTLVWGRQADGSMGYMLDRSPGVDQLINRSLQSATLNGQNINNSVIQALGVNQYAPLNFNLQSGQGVANEASDYNLPGGVYMGAYRSPGVLYGNNGDISFMNRFR